MPRFWCKPKLGQFHHGATQHARECTGSRLAVVPRSGPLVASRTHRPMRLSRRTPSHRVATRTRATSSPTGHRLASFASREVHHSGPLAASRTHRPMRRSHRTPSHRVCNQNSGNVLTDCDRAFASREVHHSGPLVASRTHRPSPQSSNAFHRVAPELGQRPHRRARLASFASREVHHSGPSVVFPEPSVMEIAKKSEPTNSSNTLADGFVTMDTANISMGKLFQRILERRKHHYWESKHQGAAAPGGTSSIVFG